MPISCSKVPKMWVLKGKSAQKPRFCARKARKQGFRRVKAHKNLDFVLERPENEGFEWQKRTKTSILCSKDPKMRVSNGKSAQKPRFCARKTRKWGFPRAKAHKNADYVLGKKGLALGRGEIRIGKHNMSLPANHRARPQNINTS